ncbi:hypothetical protein TVAG_197960 [Trichomonas vaginalis G3]|uniref:Uncharacterized protein n=1 Tax=Trichomonas vaginalis (strain ATCC PRA-98 / G3) TaxID=412133 RepID=A2EJL2_TRIV3|nr:protein phosphatase regulator protein [Trichomonas vaginalis G3]EAY07182.1 hypothetical protein TVAG_197960 [Trichomonas vaginalis G3]KAI5503634.1 protein phosphatase regulator protein [Trichomonas vaginalis G3]|eukprot:XP_001319405.1 hypothetical protein [Trichomonas vaginalis G3]
MLMRYPKTKSSISILSTIMKSKTLEKVRSATKVRITPYKTELPDADLGDFDTKAYEKCHFKRTRNISLPSLPPIPSPSDKTFNSILLRKIQLCETLCDYSNPRNDSFAKKLKKEH